MFDNKQDEKAFQTEWMKQFYHCRFSAEYRQLNKTLEDTHEEPYDLNQQFGGGHLGHEINSKVEILLGKCQEVGEAAKREAQIHEAKEREEELSCQEQEQESQQQQQTE